MSVQRQQGPSSSGMPPRSGRPASPVKPKNPTCPLCRRRMTVKQVTPVLFASGMDDVIYGCEDCSTEVKRTIKQT